MHGAPRPGASSRARGQASTRAASEAAAEAKLALTEYLITSNDFDACAQRGLEWLHENAGIANSILLAVDVDPTRLVTVAAHGLPADADEPMSIALEDHDHPLVQALGGRDPLWFATGPAQPATPLGATAFHAIPLRSEETPAEGDAYAILLLESRAPELATDVRWFVDVFGKKIDRIRARRAVQDSRFHREHRQLLGILNAVTDPILLTDFEGKLIIANGRAERLFAAPDDASEGRRRAVTMNNMLFSSALAAAAMGGDHNEGTSRRELVLVDPSDGSDLLFELLASPMRDAREGYGVVAILRNVTDLGRASEQLLESQRRLTAAQNEMSAERNRLELIIDSVADPILVTDPRGDVVMFNAPAERLFTVDEKAGPEEHRHVLANDAHFSSFVSNLLFSGSDLRYRGEIGLVDPATGRPLPVEAVSGKVLTEFGELTAVVTILHDRTEAAEKARLYAELERASKQLEQKVRAATSELAQQNEILRRQALELEQASALKTQFLANMSHEFRTPLNAILGYTYMLLNGVSGKIESQVRRNLDRVDSNARHLLTIINEILDITRIEAGKMPLHLSAFKLDDLIREVFSELDPIIQRSPVKVGWEVPKSVPEIVSDRQKLKQIVLNLLSNALKFTHKGSIWVHASTDPRTKKVFVAVADTGIGIAPEDQDKVFEDFRQVDNSPTRQYGGTGLGLSIVRRLAKMLDGKIHLRSEVGRGSTFTIEIPKRLRKR